MPFSLGVSSPLGPPRLAASLFSSAFGPSPRSGNAARSGTDHLRAMSTLKQNLAQKSHARRTVRQNESMVSADAVESFRGLSNDGVTVVVTAEISLQPRLAPGAPIFFF